MIDTTKNILALLGAIYASKGAIWFVLKMGAFMTKTKKDDHILSKIHKKNTQLADWASSLFSTKGKL